MKIVTLTENEFTIFSNNHKYSNYYQTINYAKLMKSEGYNYRLIGFVNNSNDLIGSSMILYKNVLLNYKIGYAPFGFLIDYSNNDLIEEISKKLKLLLLKEKFISIKINPKIRCSERDKHGNIISYNPETNDILEILTKHEFIHKGFNNYFENEKPRWNAILKLTSSNENLYKNLDKQTRNKISKANRLGVEIEKGTINDLKTLYEFIKRKHNRSYKHYKNMLQEFDNSCEIYLAKINTRKYLMQNKNAYENELIENEKYNELIQKEIKKGKNIDHIIVKKMESDRRLSSYNKELQNATILFSKYPNNLTIGGAIIIKNKKEVNLVIEGFNKKYTSFNSNYLLKWEIIKKFNTEEYEYFNLNGIVGEFKETNKYSGLNEMKLGYNANAVEYIGEFELIINKTIYNIYNNKFKKKKLK